MNGVNTVNKEEGASVKEFCVVYKKQENTYVISVRRNCSNLFYLLLHSGQSKEILAIGTRPGIF